MEGWDKKNHLVKQPKKDKRFKQCSYHFIQLFKTTITCHIKNYCTCMCICVNLELLKVIFKCSKNDCEKGKVSERIK